MQLELLLGHVISMLESNLPKDLLYHNCQHTLDVKYAASKYAILEEINEEDSNIVVSASILHDIGYLVKYHENEPEAVKISKELLPKFGYNQSQIDKICKCIMATIIPQKAETLIEKIVCDADLDYLGSSDYAMTAQKLKKEWISYGLISNDDLEWNKVQYDFILNHNYFTESAKKLRNSTKLENLKIIENKLIF